MLFLFTNDIAPMDKGGIFQKKNRLLNSTPTIATSVSSFNISVLVPKVVAIQVVNMHMVDNIIPLLCHIAIHDTHPSVFLVYSLAVFSSTCRIRKSPLPQKSSLFPFYGRFVQHTSCHEEVDFSSYVFVFQIHFKDSLSVAVSDLCSPRRFKKYTGKSPVAQPDHPRFSLLRRLGEVRLDRPRCSGRSTFTPHHLCNCTLSRSRWTSRRRSTGPPCSPSWPPTSTRAARRSAPGPSCSYGSRCGTSPEGGAGSIWPGTPREGTSGGWELEIMYRYGKKDGSEVA